MRSPTWTWWRVALLLSFALAVSCGSCDENTGSPGTNNGAEDAGGDMTDPGDVNADANAGTSCGIYSTLCDGECIPTSSDPDNCGGCDVVCEDEAVCSGGHCATECTGGLTACERKCVDTANDSDHCGECGEACADGLGCVDSECVDIVDVDFDGAQCEGGGPVIDLGEEVVEERRCAPQLAELTFRYGVCSCTEFDMNNDLLVDAYDSSRGPYVPGSLGGGVGVNDGFTINNNATITGVLWTAGNAGVDFGGRSEIGLRLLSGGDLTTNEEGTVGRDAFINGEMNLNAPYDIGGTLHLPPGVDAPQDATYGALENEDVVVPQPCTECPPDDHIDVAAIVAGFEDPADNDNSDIGLDPDLLNPAPDDPIRLDLPCGAYFLSGIDSNEPVTIVAHGNTALLIGGDVVSNNPLTITLTPDAQLDVFVAGNVNTNNEFKLGSPNYPALQRVYVGGDTGFTTNNEVTLGGYLYAVPGAINTNNAVEVFGGLYANSVVVNNEWNIHFDRRVTTVGEHCDDPDDPDDPPTTRCTTEGDDCTESADCCSPLTCEMGTCQLLDCVPSFGSCTDSAECCSGTCSSGTDGICVVQ